MPILVRQQRRLTTNRHAKWERFKHSFSGRSTQKPQSPILYWAVIFTTTTTQNLDGYEETDENLEELLKDVSGFIGVESSSNHHFVLER